MTHLAQYQDRFSFIDLTRTRSGILTMRLHRDGGPIKWTSNEGGAHSQIGEALWYIARDPENRVVILTGTGDVFMTEHVPAEYAPFTAENWARLTREAKDSLTGLVDLDRPLISIVNGPATVHPELGVLGDVVLAADDAIFQDTHLERGNVPSDGCHTVWRELLGLNRSRAFLLTGSVFTAQQLCEWGVVAEVMPRDQLMPRAIELAEKWLKQPGLVMNFAHTALTNSFKMKVLDEVGSGHALEGLGKYSAASPAKSPQTINAKARV